MSILRFQITTAPRRVAPLAASLLLAASACTKEGSAMDSGLPADHGPSTSDTVGADRGPDAPLGPPIRVKVATFNARNFFDEVDDPTKQDDLPSVSEVAAKLEQLGAALRRLDADVVALQEIETKTLLVRLRDQELAGKGYDHVRLVEGNDIRGTDVALLSRFPVPRLISHTQDRFQGVDGDTTTYGFSRDCLEATIEPSSGRRLVLLVNHLRAHDSDSSSEDDDRRYAQAKRVREIADELLQDVPTVNLAVLGDLNDEPDTKTLALLRSGVAPLHDVAETLPQSERYTTSYRGDHQQFDYILVSPGLQADLVEGSVRIDRDAVFSETSDHFPVLAEFTVE